MTASITQVPGTGATPNIGRTTWNNNDQALADEINAHEASTTSAHGGLISLPNLDWKPSVRAATTANITLSGTQTIDGVAVVAGDRVLVKSQTTGSDNGIYVVAAGAWSRATDASSSSTVHPRMSVAVSEGTTNNGKLYQLTNTGTINLGTTALTFQAFGASTLTAGSYTLVSLIIGADGSLQSIASGAPGAIADASTSVKGAVLMSAAPVSSTSPIAVGSNDPSLQTKLEGLTLTWDSATQLGVETGCAWIPSLNKVLDVPTRLTLAVSSPGVNTKQYIYLTSTGTLVASATVPVTYKGDARQMTGDNTKRYLGMIIGNAAGTGMYKWRWTGVNQIWFLESMGTGSFFRVSGSLSASTNTSIPLASWMPPSSQLAELWLYNQTSADIALSNSEANFTLSQSNFLHKYSEGSDADEASHAFQMPTDSSQAILYQFNATPGTAGALSIRGYTEER